MYPIGPGGPFSAIYRDGERKDKSSSSVVTEEHLHDSECLRTDPGLRQYGRRLSFLCRDHRTFVSPTLTEAELSGEEEEEEEED